MKLELTFMKLNLIFVKFDLALMKLEAAFVELEPRFVEFYFLTSRVICPFMVKLSFFTVIVPNLR